MKSSVFVLPFFGVCFLAFTFTALLQPASSISVSFRIKPVMNNSNCLTVPGNSNDDNTNLAFAACNSSNGYQSMLAYNPLSMFQLQTALSSYCGKGLCMTASNPGGDETLINTATCNATNLAQYWTQPVPSDAAVGYSRLQNWGSSIAGTPFCATAELEGQYVDQYTCQTTGAPHQNWKIVSDDVGFAVENGLSDGTTNYCLGVKDANPQEESTFDVPICSNTSYAQHYTVLSTFAWQIKVKTKCLDGGSGLGSLYQWDCTATAPNQKWLSISYPNDPSKGVPIMDMYSGLCITWDPSAYGNVFMSACTKGLATQYFFANF